MGKMQTHPQRMKFAKHAHQCRCNSLREHRWDFGADTDDIDMCYLPQAVEQPLQAVITYRQGISAGYQNIANLRCGSDVIDGFLPA